MLCLSTPTPGFPHFYYILGAFTRRRFRDGRLAPNVPNSLEYDVPDWSRHDSHVVSLPIYTARFRCCIWVIVFRTVPM